MEIINNPPVTPHRLYALLRLVEHLGSSTREQLFTLLQPEDSKADFARYNLTAASYFELVDTSDNQAITLHASVASDDLQNLDSFRKLMQARLLGRVKPNDDNYRLNIFAAWYAVQDDKVFSFPGSDEFAETFRNAILPTDADAGVEQGTAFNREKYVSWRRWAEFLGWGWTIRQSTSYIAPDAMVRLLPVLPAIFGDDEQLASDVFLERVGQYCPELDKGVLYQQCWAAVRSETKTTVSMMLSHALHALQEDGVIELIRQPDAATVWPLFPINEPYTSSFSHVRYIGGAA
jgi:hypothetical protein